jgi:hypothetical protein
MALAAIDIIEGALWREVDGTPTEVRRTAVLQDLTAPTGADSLMRAALDDPALPLAGAQHPTETALLLRERIPRALDPFTCQVELVYKLPPGGGIEIPPGYPTTIRGGSAVEQVETAVDRYANPIIVSRPGHPDQGGKIHPFVAGEQLSLGETAQSADPTLIGKTWTNLVNTGPFFFDLAALPRTWLIMEIGFELVSDDTVPFWTWDFTYELRKRPWVLYGVAGSWDPQVVYNDPETNRPPADLVAGEGYKTVEWHIDGNFALLFGP